MTPRGRRLALVVVVAGMVVGPAIGAHAQTLAEYLERGSGARFSGSQSVRCETPDGPREVVVDLVQTDGVFSTVASSDTGGTVTVAGGTLSVVRPDGSASSTAVPVSDTPVAGGYSIEEVETANMIGRPATRIAVDDPSGVPRAELAFDEVTGALLFSRVLDGDGSVYCETTMTSFDDSAAGAAPAPEAEQPLESIEEHAGLPETVAGFRRLDAYRWDDDGVIGFYSDGLFSFSLLVTSRAVELAAEDVSELEGERGSYTRWFGAGQVVTVWDGERGGLAVSGDLPLDLLDAVLAGLPPPDTSGLLSRMWRNLFG